jgi:hypothetical protein
MPVQRRNFLTSAAAILPAAALNNLIASPAGALSASAAHAQSSAAPPASEIHVVPAGQDRLGAPHSLGYSSLAFKVLTSDTGGNLFVIEHSHLVPGGPPLHLHLNQDEWFYVMEGEVPFRSATSACSSNPANPSSAAPRASRVQLGRAREPHAHRLHARRRNGKVLP